MFRSSPNHIRFRTIFHFISLVLLTVILSVSAVSASTDGYVPPLPVLGDAAEPTVLGADALANTVEVTRRNRTYQALPLLDVVEQVRPLTELFSVFLIADDLAAQVDGDRLDQSYIAFSSEYGWEAVHLLHPASANIKRLERIIIVGETDQHGFGIHTISQTQNLASTSPGALQLDGFSLNYRREGAASLLHEDGEYISTVYSPQKIVSRETLLNQIDSVPAQVGMVVGEKGELRDLGEGHFTVSAAALEFRDAEGRIMIPDVAGLVLDPPERRITDAYHDALQFLEAGRAVLLVILDGFGYHQYEYAVAHGHAPFLASQSAPERAMAVYQPVTNAGISAILTGTTPEHNGVYSRRQRMPEAPDVFAGAAAMAKKSLYFAGDRQIVATSLEPRFHFDTTGSGSSDDDIVLAALDVMAGAEIPDLLVLHIKDLDRAGHNYGDLDGRTMEKVAEADEYLRKLSNAWQGRIIVTVDHGMHSTDHGGSHGVLCYEDVFVPYWIMEGERSYETQ